jgi:hypothetical protein
MNICFIVALSIYFNIPYETVSNFLEKNQLREYGKKISRENFRIALLKLGYKYYNTDVIYHGRPMYKAYAIGYGTKENKMDIMTNDLENMPKWKKFPDCFVVTNNHIMAFKEGILFNSNKNEIVREFIFVRENN